MFFVVTVLFAVCCSFIADFVCCCYVAVVFVAVNVTYYRSLLMLLRTWLLNNAWSH